jgi:uncharacterized protein
MPRVGNLRLGRGDGIFASMADGSSPRALVLQDGGGCRFRIRVKSSAGRERIVGLYGDSVKVAVREAPVDGKANQAVCAMLARILGVQTGAVTIVAGGSSPDKWISVQGLAPAECLEKLRPFIA